MGRRWLGPLLVATTVAAASTAAAGPLYVVKRHPSEVRFRTVYTGDWVHASRIAADIVVNANFYWKNVPLGIIVQEGRLVSRGLRHKPPRPCFVVQQVNGRQRVRIVEAYERGGRIYTRAGRLTNVRTLVQGGPRLVTNGRVTVHRKREGFRGDVARRTTHVGLGITASGRVLIVAQRNVTLQEFARTFVRLGARQAMNLDGGHSATLAVNGRVRLGSGRILAGLAIQRTLKRRG